MREETISRDESIVIRRMVLEAGEAMPWHSDSCRRISTVIRGERLRIEFRDGEDVAEEVLVSAGVSGWDEPEMRIHRAVNVGESPYEEVTVYFLAAPDADPQPLAAEQG